MPGGWKRLSSKYVYENPWIKVREDQVIRPDGKRGIYGVVEPNQRQGVSVVAVDEAGKIWMVKHHRYVFNDEAWELADGDVEKDEAVEEAARRELLEELGLKASNWKSLGQFRPSDGLLEQRIEVFLATGLSVANSPTEEYDIRDRRAFILTEVDEMIAGGEIGCGYVMNALYFYKLYLNQ